MAGVLRAWTSLATERPLLTITMTNGALGGLGDLLAQTIESHNTHKRFHWDIPRTLRFVLWGTVCAPVVHKWYLHLNKKFPLPSSISSKPDNKRLFITALAKRVIADQLLYAPVGIAGFFVSMNFLEGHNWQRAKKRLSTFYWPTLGANYLVWPAVQAINFGFVPVIYRVPFSSAVSVFWNAFISWANKRSGEDVRPLDLPHLHLNEK